MSYVLEALKKSQSQREQGAVPGIHSLQIPYQAIHDKPRATHKRLLWTIVLLLVAIVALLIWRMAAPAPASPEPVSLPVPEVAQPASVLTATVTEPVSAPDPAPSEALPSATPVVQLEKEDATPVKKKERAPRKEAAKAAAVEPRVYLVPELPQAIRSTLPPLVISGGAYSSNPAQRLIIVNNQVFTEGSQPVPGVVVQRIEPGAAVLIFQGYWYRLGY